MALRVGGTLLYFIVGGLLSAITQLRLQQSGCASCTDVRSGEACQGGPRTGRVGNGAPWGALRPPRGPLHSPGPCVLRPTRGTPALRPSFLDVTTIQLRLLSFCTRARTAPAGCGARASLLYCGGCRWPALPRWLFPAACVPLPFLFCVPEAGLRTTPSFWLEGSVTCATVYDAVGFLPLVDGFNLFPTPVRPPALLSTCIVCGSRPPSRSCVGRFCWLGLFLRHCVSSSRPGVQLDPPLPPGGVARVVSPSSPCAPSFHLIPRLHGPIGTAWASSRQPPPYGSCGGVCPMGHRPHARGGGGGGGGGRDGRRTCGSL